jgi:hypothetical protein
MDATAAKKIAQEVFRRIVVDTGGHFTSQQFEMTVAGLVLAVHNKAIDKATELASGQVAVNIKSLRVDG